MDETAGPYTITLASTAWRFTANADEALVAAAARADISLPASCRNGTCRTCMCFLVEGEIAYPGGRPGLTAEEMEEGWILPCVGRARTDLCIDAPGAAPMEKSAPRPIAIGPRR